MTKKKGAVSQLAEALKKRKKNRGNPHPLPPPEKYRFQKGVSGNPLGHSKERVIYAQALTDRMMRSCPPRELCESIGIDASVTWGEAIMIVLGRAALAGDVSAAREVLAALGINGTTARTNVLLNVEQPEQRGLVFELLRHAHGIAEADMVRVYEFMDSLPKEQAAIDAACFPDDSYREAPAQLSEGKDGER